ncbi:MAG: DUF3990 domain-containing protein [Bacilli bacterium]|jgi:hypothetical protein
MNRKLYHGSDRIVEKPMSNVGNIHNDYGLGFYCTTIERLAKEWGSRKNGVGYVNRYVLRDDRFKILDLTKPPFGSVLYWVALLMHNRELSNETRTKYLRELGYLEKQYLIDVKEYDVVIGYRADDSYFQFPEAFVRSEITFDSLQKIFAAGDLGKQYVLISQRAFNNIHFKGYFAVDEESRKDYYSRKNSADKIFTDLLEQDRYSKGKRLRDLVMNDEDK